VACNDLTAAGIAAEYFVADCSVEQEVRSLARDAVKKMGKVDILINNAGASWGSPAEKHPLSAWDKVMNVNIRGYFILSQEVANLSMIPNQRGRIVNISSIAGLAGNRLGMHTVAYNTSKGAVMSFTRALAAEWGQHGITVNAICPGFFPSKMTKGFIRHVGADNIVKNVPLRRLGDDEDLKGVTVLYASEAGKHITGQYLAIDGGVSAVIG
jgi:NAD(P)-dependent dehydrogenase (short-subunit alcohol dehydrogenase family)